MDLARQIDALLPLVSKPTRYLGNEFHAVRKDPGPDAVRWCLILPEVYEIGMSHWGLKILYDILNRRPDALAERCFAPWVDMEGRMRRHGVPLFSLETRRPVGSFDFVGFSLQYELTYTNLLNCLDLAGIPLRAEDRDERHPLVIGGGPCVSNPEPASDFFDLYLIGDAEEAIHVLTDAYRGLRGRPRAEILRELAKLPGIYVPLMYEASYSAEGRLLGLKPRFADVPPRVRRQFVTELESAPYPEFPIVPLQEIAQDRLSVEVLRGCTQGCRFCQAGYLYRPIRERSPEKVLEIADRGIRNSGWSEISLVSLSTADYTQLTNVADILNARFGAEKVAISLPSLRADSFGVEIADRVRETRKTGFTFAPEAGSERLRLAVNKNIRDDEFFAAAEIAYSRGWRLIKMYFMVGLPTETWGDVEGIVRFVEKVQDIGRRHGPSCSVNASVGAFVPKSHTPFQWDGFEDLGLLKEKIRFLRERIRGRWARLKWHEVLSSHVEAVMSLGDRRLGRVIERAWRAGARFDGWTEHFRHERWMRALAEEGIDPARITGPRPFDAPLPWDHIDIGILKKWLVRERRKTEAAGDDPQAQLVPDCRHGACTACGIPGLPNDTKLTPEVTSEEMERLLARARAGSPRPEGSAGPGGAAGGTSEEQPAPVTWPVRLRFEKVGSARFLSHLELGTVLSRAFRMARVPLAFSQGHHPHPKLSFGPPLPVGIEGEGELFDADLLEPWHDGLAARLNAVLPEGIRILAGAPIAVIPGVQRQAIAVLAKKAGYRIDLSALPAERRAAFPAVLEEFAACAERPVERSHWTPARSREALDWEAPWDPAAAAGGGDAAHAPAGSDTGEEPGGGAGNGSGGETGGGAGRENGSEAGGGVVGEAGSHRRGDRRAPAGRTPRGRSARGRPGNPAPRVVDLRRAITRLEPIAGEAGSRSEPDRGGAAPAPGPAALFLELHLEHPQGHTANPWIVLERLFLLSPEEQARVRVRRQALLPRREPYPPGPLAVEPLGGEPFSVGPVA